MLKSGLFRSGKYLQVMQIGVAGVAACDANCSSVLQFIGASAFNAPASRRNDTQRLHLTLEGRAVDSKDLGSSGAILGGLFQSVADSCRFGFGEVTAYGRVIDFAHSPRRWIYQLRRRAGLLVPYPHDRCRWRQIRRVKPFNIRGQFANIARPRILPQLVTQHQP